MKFLAIDTSEKYLTVLAYRDGIAEKIYLDDCAMKHSTVLMGKIEEVFARAHLSAGECDFFAAVVGPGSFTGIRIGISTVKGLCFACGKPALSVTSFDCIAYDRKGKTLALSDAGRNEFYACGYENGEICLAPCVLSRAETDEILREGYTPAAVSELFEGCVTVDPCEGLLHTVLQKAALSAPPAELKAVYLRKSSAEENRK